MAAEDLDDPLRSELELQRERLGELEDDFPELVPMFEAILDQAEAELATKPFEWIVRERVRGAARIERRVGRAVELAARRLGRESLARSSDWRRVRRQAARWLARPQRRPIARHRTATRNRRLRRTSGSRGDPGRPGDDDPSELSSRPLGRLLRAPGGVR